MPCLVYAHGTMIPSTFSTYKPLGATRVTEAGVGKDLEGGVFTGTARTILELGGVLAVGLYAVMWTFVNAVASRFSVSAENLGLTWDWVLPRVFAVTIFVLVSGFTIFVIPFTGGRIPSVGRVHEFFLWSMTCSAFGVLLAVLFDWRLGILTVATSGLLAVVPVFLISTLIRVMSVRSAGELPRSGIRRIGALLALLAILAAVSPFVWAARIVEEVKAGQNVKIDLSIGLTLLSIEKVRLGVGTTQTTDVVAGCQFLLGTDGTVYYFYDAHRQTTTAVSRSVVPVIQGPKTCR